MLLFIIAVSTIFLIFVFLLARPLLLLKYVSNPLTAQKTFDYICFLTVIVDYVMFDLNSTKIYVRSTIF